MLAPDREVVRDVLRRDDEVHVLTVLVSDCHLHQDTTQRNQDGGVRTIKLEPEQETGQDCPPALAVSPHGELMFGVWRVRSDDAVSTWSLLLPPD